MGQNRKLYSYNKSNDEITLLEHFPVACFTTSDSYLLMAPETSSIHIFTANNLHMPINIHKFYQSPALCSPISESFRTVVIGSQGRLIIAPLENGSSMMTINIQDYTPLQILITQNFGFIVTYAMKIENAAIVKVILMHSLAGKLLHVKDIDFDLDLMVDWTDCDGIDFLAVSDTSGQIFASEAYDLPLSFVIQRCLSPIISMKYCKELKSLIAITTNGNIFIDPVNINATIY